MCRELEVTQIHLLSFFLLTPILSFLPLSKQWMLLSLTLCCDFLSFSIVLFELKINGATVTFKQNMEMYLDGVCK